MHYYLSAYRAPSHKDGYEVADRLKFATFTDALAWVGENAFAAKSHVVGLNLMVGMAPANHEPGVFEASYQIPRLADDIDRLFDEPEVARRTREFERQKAFFEQHFRQIDDIETVLIERQDRAKRAIMEEYHEGNPVRPLGATT